MKTIKLSTGKELSVLDTTHYANLIQTAPNSPSAASELLDDLTDEALTHVELWAGLEMQDVQDNQTFHQLNLEKTDWGYLATYTLIGKEGGIPAEIMDKANAYDILMGGEVNG